MDSRHGRNVVHLVEYLPLAGLIRRQAQVRLLCCTFNTLELVPSFRQEACQIWGERMVLEIDI